MIGFMEGGVGLLLQVITLVGVGVAACKWAWVAWTKGFPASIGYMIGALVGIVLFINMEWLLGIFQGIPQEVENSDRFSVDFGPAAPEAPAPGGGE